MTEGMAQVGDHVRAKPEADQLIRGLEGLVVSRSAVKRDEVYVRFDGLPRSERVPIDELLVIEAPERSRRRTTEQAEGGSEIPERRIVQLLPAPGWWAVFANWQADPAEPVLERIIAWALFEEGPCQTIEGVLPPDDEAVNYADLDTRELPLLEYVHEGTFTASGLERLRRRVRQVRGRELGRE